MINARSPNDDDAGAICTGCHNHKQATIATIVVISHKGSGVLLALCEICARDAANAIGFFCIRDGGWSKLEPRSKKREDALRPTDKKTREKLARDAR